MTAVRKRVLIVLEIGGTTIKFGRVEADSGSLLDFHSVTTPRVAQQVVRAVTDAVSSMEAASTATGLELIGIGLSVAAPVTSSDGRTASVANLPGLHDIDLASTLQTAFGLPVFVENDANAALVGEMHAGSGRGLTSCVLVILGTGLGVGVVADGKLLRGHMGAAGEIAYLPVLEQDVDPNLTKSRTPHDIVVGPAMEATAARVRSAYVDTSLTLNAVASEIILESSLGDPLAEAIVKQASRVMARLVTILQSVIAPEVILFGGSVGSNAILVDAIRTSLDGMTQRCVSMRAAELGQNAGLYGMAHIVKSQL
jgi:predicted NBD/HSP70 family sugar kinase